MKFRTFYDSIVLEIMCMQYSFMYSIETEMDNYQII